MEEINVYDIRREEQNLHRQHCVLAWRAEWSKHEEDGRSAMATVRKCQISKNNQRVITKGINEKKITVYWHHCDTEYKNIEWNSSSPVSVSQVFIMLPYLHLIFIF